ncbi:MAG TPA: XRE family transcriptional regulator [Verrucomicrobiae bacterium]
MDERDPNQELPNNNEGQEDPSTAADSNSQTLDLQKLRKLRKGLRLTQAELASVLGIHRTYLVLIEKGKKIPSPRLERSILDFMDKAERESLSPQSLWRQAGNANVTTLVSEPPARRAPVVSWAAAGVARAYEDLANQIEETVETDCKDPNTFAIIIEGDSMEHKFYAGDRVVFAPNSEPRNGDAVVAKLNDGRVYFKYFYRTGHEGSRVKLVSENANYSPLEFDRSEFTFVYPAWEIKRKLRR